MFTNKKVMDKILFSRECKFLRPSVLKKKTYPIPPSILTFSLKSTEFKEAGFHLRTSSHLPVTYGCKRKCIVVRDWCHCIKMLSEIATYVFCRLENKPIRLMRQSFAKFLT